MKLIPCHDGGKFLSCSITIAYLLSSCYIASMATCKLCGTVVAKTEIFDHYREAHPEKSQAALDAARAKNPKVRQKVKVEGEKPSPAPAAAAPLDSAVSVVISPKSFSMNSVLLWQAREAAIQEWGWDSSLTPEDFLDTYLYVSFKQRGIILGGYQVIRRDGDGSKGSEELRDEDTDA